MKKYRKQFAFDLKEDRNTPLIKYYNSYKSKPYEDICSFMTGHGFVPRQRSVYVSKEEMGDKDVRKIVSDMCKELPWLAECSRAFDVTDIGKQHGLLAAITEACEFYEEDRIKWLERVQSEREQKEKGDLSPMHKDSIQDIIDKASEIITKRKAKQAIKGFVHENESNISER